MTRPDSPDSPDSPGSPGSRDDDLRALLEDAVAGVEPTPRLGSIRARTATPARRRGARWWAVAGAAVATAAVVAVVGTVLRPDTAPEREQTADRGPTTPAQDPRGGAETPTTVAAVYFVGGTPAGDRLYREFQTLPAGAGPAGVIDALMAGPDDPDYATRWPAGSLDSVAVADGALVVGLGDAAPVDDELARQQLVYSLQALEQRRMPVRLEWADGRTTPLRPVTRGAVLDTLAPVSISDPAEGLVVDGSLRARGVANAFEATVTWQLLDAEDTVVDEGFATASGFGDRLYPWRTRIDVGGLAPGTYTFVAADSDPTGGAEGPGPATDTRTIVVR